jgi:ATP-dependent Zn protease
MDRVRNRVEKMNFQDSNLSVPAKKLVGLERAIEVHEKRIAFLNQTLVNENLTEKQKEVIERRLEHAQNVTNKLVEINEDKKDKLVTKIMAKQNLTQEQVEAIFQLKKQNRERIKEQIRENKE